LLLEASGDGEGALECYRAAVAVKPDFTEALLNLGHALKAYGKESEAKLAWSKAVEAAPELAAKYFS
jgi:protein O-GlcNAc transferase